MLKAEGVAPVALELGKSAGWVSQITHGNTIPSDEVLVKLAKKYAKSDEILGELLHAAAFARLSSQKFDEPVLRENAIAAWKSQLDAPTQKSRRTERRGTLASFPDAFYPLAVVSGDKRENSISRINVADFGAVSASPAEARWIFKLGLKRDVEFYTDKVFVLESEVQLKKRFGRKNLLLMGSPGSNQLTRRCHLATPPAGWRRAVPIFRFNALQQRLSDIEDLLKALSSFVSPQRLVGAQESPEAQRNMKFLLQNLFHGGIIDPTYRDLWLRGTALWNTDFGLISFARNPFADSDDFVCHIHAS
jgi:transcriptional regulator with XRE-family HTH domain